MTNPLPPNQLENLLPALRHVAELVQKSGAPNREDLQLLLIACELEEDWAIDELQRWARALAAVRRDGREQTRYCSTRPYAARRARSAR